MSEYNDIFENRTFFDIHIEWISEHVDHFFKDAEVSVFHELMSFGLPIHIYYIKPKGAAFHVLLTEGMSVLKMNVPPNEVDENPEDLAFAELMMLIPATTKFEDAYTGKNKNDWMLTALKRTAKFPHLFDTWIGQGHSIQTDKDFTPYGNDTKYAGAVILPSMTFDEKFTEIKRNGTTINIYGIFPIYKNELEYKVKHGYNKFVDLLIKANIDEVINPNRKNLLPKKAFWSKLWK